MSINRPGARPKNKILKKYYVNDKGHVLASDSDRICGVLELVNYVALLVDKKNSDVTHAELLKIKPKLWTLAYLTYLVQGLKFGGRLTL